MVNHVASPVALALLILPCSSLLAVPPRDALDGESRMEFIETPLAQIADFLSDQHAVKFALAPTVERNEPVSVNARGRLGDLLTKILRPLDLEYRVQQDTILSKTGITDDGLLTLAGIPTLEAILVADTRFTDKGIARLREKRPQVRVLTERPRTAKPQPDGANQANPSDPFGGRRR